MTAAHDVAARQAAEKANYDRGRAMGATIWRDSARPCVEFAIAQLRAAIDDEQEQANAIASLWMGLLACLAGAASASIGAANVAELMRHVTQTIEALALGEQQTGATIQ